MRFRRRNTKETTPPVAGTHATAHGIEAALSAEALAVDALVTGGLDDAGAAGIAPLTRHAASGADALGLVAGYAASGLRSAAVLAPGRVGPSLAELDAQLPFVLHLAGLVDGGKGSEVATHSVYYTLAHTAAFAMFAADPQQVADFSLIAHRIAETTLGPGVCAQDLYQTTHGLRSLQPADAELVAAYLGRSDDTIDTPTPAQNILFGDRRRRVPQLVDVDHPVGVGSRYNNDSAFKSALARRTFFASHVADAADQAMREFAALTGREYERVRAYRVEDAELVIVAQGAITAELRAVVDHLRDARKIRAGIAEITMFHPFPGAELSHLLSGKAAVTVLERAEAPLAEELPLTVAVRAAIDRATENAADGEKDAPHARYAKIDLRERPQIFSGTFGVGSGMPTFSELAAVVMNMRDARRRRFAVGADFTRDVRRHPQLHTMSQRIAREYPSLASMSLPAVDERPAENRRVLALNALSSHGVLGAANTFARVLSGALGRDVSTYPTGGLSPGLEPAAVSIAYGESTATRGDTPAVTHAGIFASVDLLERFAATDEVERGGIVVVSSGESPASLWQRLSPRAALWLRAGELKLCTVDADAIAAQSTARPTFIDQLAIWALLGATVAASAETVDRAVVEGELQRHLGNADGAGWPAGDIARAFASGAETMQLADARTMGPETRPAVEPEKPWTVTGTHDGDAFDATRFWSSVGYLYETGEARATLADPFVASGVIPARSGAFRNVTPYRLRMPHWLPENCTACGLCWATCPDTALPSTVQSVASLLDAALAAVESDGRPTTQVRRLRDHLAKAAYRIVASDDLRTHGSLGTLLGDALDQLLSKMDMSEDNRSAILEEFSPVRGAVENVMVARTATFFDAPHNKRKGDGQLLSIAVNAPSCKSCGLCIAVCPDNALELVPQEGGYLDRLDEHSAFQRTLPATAPATIDAAVASAPNGPVHWLLDTDVYHTLVGGDGAFPGTGAKIALHLAAAAVEAAKSPDVHAHVKRLDELITKTRADIQGTVTSTLSINDFDDFTRRLHEEQRDRLTGHDIADLTGAAGAARPVARLRVMSDLLERLEAQRAHIEHRARLVMALDAPDVTRWSGTYPYNPHANPWLARHIGSGAGMATSLFESIATSLAEEMDACREAGRLLNDANASTTTGSRTRWDELDDDERALIPAIVLVSNERDMDWNEVGRAVASNVPINVLVLADSAAVMATPTIPDLPAHVFVLQSSVSHPDHLMSGIVAGVKHAGPAVFRVLAPDPVQDDIAPETVVAQAGLAVSSRVFPLLRRVDGIVDLAGNPDRELPWSRRQLMFREPSGSTETVVAPITPADWAIGLGAYRDEFSIVAKGHAGGHTKPLSEFVALAADARAGLEPYVHVAGNGDRHLIATVSPKVVSLTERAAAAWRALSATPGAATAPDTKPVAEKPATPAASPAPLDGDAYQQLVDRLLWLSGFGRDPEFFAQSLGEFVLSRRGDDAGDAGTPDEGADSTH